MLENMRRQGASIFIYLIFCLLIAIFIINFRPGQSRQDSGGGCTGPNNLVVTVDGDDVSQTAYHVAYSNPYNQYQQKQRVSYALEMLIRRELLAQEAEKRGLRVSDELIDDQIKKGAFFYGGQRLSIPGAVEKIDEEKFYNHKAVKSWAGQLNVSFNSYRDEQKRGLLASMMADTIANSVLVTRDEAKAEFDYDNTLATYNVVSFKPEDYKAALHLSDADVDRYLAEHADAVSARYKADERTYKVGRQLKLRGVFIAKEETPPAAPSPGDNKPEDKKPEDKKADAKKPEDKKADAKKPGMPIDQAKAKLEAARTQIAAGKLKLADVAKELATDPVARGAGGELGWRSADNAMLGDKAVSDAVKTIKPGELTPVIATDNGVYLIMAEDQREGQLTFDQVKREIAENLARDEWSKEAAHRDAIKAATAVQSGKKLDQLFEVEPSEPYESPGQIKKQIKQTLQMLRSPGLPDEIRGPMQQQLQQLEQILRAERAQILAARETWSKDQPAAWYADDDGAGAAAGSAAPTGSSATAGSAAAGSGSGSGSGSTAAAKPAPPKDLMKPSADVLPAFTDVPHKVQKEGPAPRSHVMPGIGKSKEVADALFGTTPSAKSLYEVEGAYVVVELVEKTAPKDADFAKQADEDLADLRAIRAQSVLEDWLRDRCEALAQKGKILPNPELMIETNDKGERVQVQYKPCSSFRQ